MSVGLHDGRNDQDQGRREEVMRIPISERGQCPVDKELVKHLVGSAGCADAALGQRQRRLGEHSRLLLGVLWSQVELCPEEKQQYWASRMDDALIVAQVKTGYVTM